MHTSHTPLQNRLLVALPEDARQRIFPCLEYVPLPLGHVLYESGQTLRHAYFPTDSIVSLLNVMENGASAEISVVGNEGLVGIALLMGGDSTPSRAIVQSGGFAYRLPAQQIKDEFARHGEMLRLALRYTQCLITQMAQTAACNRHHSIDQQLCRWLLLSLDRLSDNQLTMTQGLIANMLGVRREGVTEAAGRLMRLNAIEYSRGHISVLDRPLLERLSCECYAVVRRETDRILPPWSTDAAHGAVHNFGQDFASRNRIGTCVQRAGLTRQIALPTSSATSSAPLRSSVTPTGRP